MTKLKVVSLASILFAGIHLPASATDIPVKNWEVPPYRTQSGSEGLQTMADLGPGRAFVAVDPCRLVDTRTTTQPNFPVGFGPPSLAAGNPRHFDLNSSPRCPGIPNGVAAYSLNVTATNTTGPGFILIFPKDFNQPTVSTLNYVAGQTVANAAIVPAGTSGAVTVIAGVSGTDLLIDINGYFTSEYNPNNFLYAESLTSQAAITGDNVSTVGFAVGVLGRIPTTTAGSGSAGVRGINQGTGAGGVGVWGSHAGSGWGVYGESVSGFAVNGVTGSQALGKAGVRGQDGGGPVGVGLPESAGVRGESHAGIGVLGITDTNRGVYGSHTGGAAGALGCTASAGVCSYGDLVVFGGKNFVEPHPTDASKMIRYTSLEGNESGTYFRGRGKFQNGIAIIRVPEDFRIVTDPEGLSIQVTPINQMATVAVQSIGLDRIVVRGSRNVEFFYLVNGVRHAYKDNGPIAENERMFVPETPDQPMPPYLPAALQQRLISNGTYNADGTVNMETARRLGWDKIWEEHAPTAPQPQP